MSLIIAVVTAVLTSLLSWLIYGLGLDYVDRRFAVMRGRRIEAKRSRGGAR